MLDIPVFIRRSSFRHSSRQRHPVRTSCLRFHRRDESYRGSESTSEATAESSTSGSDTASADGFATTDDVSDAPDITGITIESKMVLNYAECFNVAERSTSIGMVRVARRSAVSDRRSFSSFRSSSGVLSSSAFSSVVLSSFGCEDQANELFQQMVKAEENK